MFDPQVAGVMVKKRIKNQAQGAGYPDFTVVGHLEDRVFHIETNLFGKDGEVTFLGIL